jgi:hypothetical protein
MTFSISNTTGEICGICLEPYQEQEVQDIDKTIQLICGHIFHRECAKLSSKYQRETGRDLSCGYCTQVYAPKAELINVYADKQAFRSRLNIIKEEYSHDIEITHVIPHINGIREQLFNLRARASERLKKQLLGHIDRY